MCIRDSPSPPRQNGVRPAPFNCSSQLSSLADFQQEHAVVHEYSHNKLRKPQRGPPLHQLTKRGHRHNLRQSLNNESMLNLLVPANITRSPPDIRHHAQHTNSALQSTMQWTTSSLARNVWQECLPISWVRCSELLQGFRSPPSACASPPTIAVSKRAVAVHLVPVY
eukprot:3105438-Amphidinium_carterae.1